MKQKIGIALLMIVFTAGVWVLRARLLAPVTDTSAPSPSTTPGGTVTGASSPRAGSTENNSPSLTGDAGSRAAGGGDAAPSSGGQVAGGGSGPSSGSETGPMGEGVMPSQSSDAGAFNYQDAKHQIETKLRANPKNYSMQMQAAEFYMNSNDYVSAIPHLQAATHLTSRVFPWIALGDAATLAHRFPLAQQAYHRARALSPKNALVLRGEGQLLIAQEKFNEARKALEAAVKQYPDNTDLRMALGNLYLILNKPHNAVAVLEPAVQKEPYRADRQALIAEAYERDLHLETALMHMREAVKRDPNLAMAWGRIGLYLVTLTRYKEARAPLERAIELEPIEPQYYRVLGDSYLLESPDEAHFDEAAQRYRQALNLDPRNGKALYSFAMALTRRGRPQDLDEAIKMFQQLLQINHNDMNAHYKLYETYKRMGRAQEAEAHRKQYAILFAKGANQTRRLYHSVAFQDTPEVHLKLARQAMAKKNYALAASEYQFALERNRMLTEARAGMLEAQKKMGLRMGEKTQ